MRTVKVNKQELLDKLKSSRESHISNFREARDNYRGVVISALRDRARAIEVGADVDINFKLPEPKSFEQEYDTAITKLEWSVEDEIELDELQFQQYVMDKWQFSEVFAASTSFYNGGVVR